MTHDNARLSALVDGELDHDARDRVLAHLAGCDECRAIVEAERRVRGLVGSLRDAAPPPPDRLMSGLLDVETMTALGQADDDRPKGPTTLTGGASRLGESVFSKSLSASRHRLRRQVVLGMAGAASAFGVTAALAFAVGGDPGPAPQVDVTPPVQQFNLQHAGSTSGQSFWEPGSINDLVRGRPQHDLVDRRPQWESGR